MSALTFDTLKFAERLEKAGASRELASAIAQAQKESLAEALDTSLATKADVQALKTDVQALKADLRELELRMTVKLGAMLVAAVGVLIAAMRMFIS